MLRGVYGAGEGSLGQGWSLTAPSEAAQPSLQNRECGAGRACGKPSAQGRMERP